MWRSKENHADKKDFVSWKQPLWTCKSLLLHWKPAVSGFSDWILLFSESWKIREISCQHHYREDYHHTPHYPCARRPPWKLSSYKINIVRIISCMWKMEPGSGTKGSSVRTLIWPLYTLSSWGRFAWNKSKMQNVPPKKLFRV